MKALVAGAVHRSGVSKKGEGKPYDFAVVNILRPARSASTEHMSATVAGLEVVEIRAQAVVVEQLAKLGPFPLECELTIDNDVGMYGQLQAVCSGARPFVEKPEILRPARTG